MSRATTVERRRSVDNDGSLPRLAGYDEMRGGIVELLEAARRAAARSINTLMTASYWEIGRRIVDYEQQGKSRAIYGKSLLNDLLETLRSALGGDSEHGILHKCVHFISRGQTLRFCRQRLQNLRTPRRSLFAYHCLGRLMCSCCQ